RILHLKIFSLDARISVGANNNLQQTIKYNKEIHGQKKSVLIQVQYATVTIVGLHQWHPLELIVYTNNNNKVINRYLFLNSDVFITAVPHRDTKEQTMSWFLKCKEVLILHIHLMQLKYMWYAPKLKEMLKGINDKDFMLIYLPDMRAGVAGTKSSKIRHYSGNWRLLSESFLLCWWLKSLSLFSEVVMTTSNASHNKKLDLFAALAGFGLFMGIEHCLKGLIEPLPGWSSTSILDYSKLLIIITLPFIAGAG
ncbi:hypothetical protein ACJX0J_011989, partial [Zea mays]